MLSSISSLMGCSEDKDLLGFFDILMVGVIEGSLVSFIVSWLVGICPISGRKDGISLKYGFGVSSIIRLLVSDDV